MTAPSCRLPKAWLPVKLICRTVVLFALRNVIDEIDPVIAAVDNLRIDADIVAPGMPVSLDDAADVGLHRGAL